MYFWCICGEEGDLHVLLLRHLEGPLQCLIYLKKKVFIFEGRTVLLDTEFLVDHLFPLVHWLCHLPTFWAPWFLIVNQLLILWRIPWIWWATSFASFKILSVDFDSMIMKRPGINFFCLSWLDSVELLGCADFFQQMWEIFCHYFFKNVFCPFLFLSSWNCLSVYVCILYDILGS